MRILSGIQPTGEPHLGNYFGAIKQQIELQQQGEALYFIADFHALTTMRDAAELRHNTRVVAATYLALGLDPKKAVLFRQSDVPQVHELAFMLECVTSVGALMRSHAYKDKVEKGLSPNVGLLCYPALMAADILIYGSDIVPVGQDQVSHVELCKDMAQSFNAAFSTDILKPPTYRLSETAKVPGTDGQKMSKSYKNTIPIFARGKALKAAVASIVTDSRNPKVEPLDPDATVLNLLRLFSQKEADKHEALYRTCPQSGFPGYGYSKEILLNAIHVMFDDARKEFDRLMQPTSELDAVLYEGGMKARQIAEKTIYLCRQAVGIR
ncbi:MAG: tryptophan--tRNA ligase [Nitrospira sp.]